MNRFIDRKVPRMIKNPFKLFVSIPHAGTSGILVILPKLALNLNLSEAVFSGSFSDRLEAICEANKSVSKFEIIETWMGIWYSSKISCFQVVLYQDTHNLTSRGRIYQIFVTGLAR